MTAYKVTKKIFGRHHLRKLLNRNLLLWRWNKVWNAVWNTVKNLKVLGKTNCTYS